MWNKWVAISLPWFGFDLGFWGSWKTYARNEYRRSSSDGGGSRATRLRIR